jgi:lipopolysaccharide transport system permease protein
VELESSVAATPVASPPHRAVRRIEASRGIILPDLGEIWRFKELLYYLLWRDIKARYKQTFLGGFWAIFRPIVQMVMASFIFGHLAHIQPGNGVNYPLFYFCGILLWTYFQSAVSGGASSVLGAGGIISKAYFPRVFAPFAAVSAPLVDLALSFTVAVFLFVYYSQMPTWRIVTMPLFLMLSLLIALGVGFWLAPISIRYRDMAFALPFVLQIWMYATPIIYPASLVHEKAPHWEWLLNLNPMTGAIEGFRWSLLGGETPTTSSLAISVGVMLVLVITGALHFRRAERTFVDVL